MIRSKDGRLYGLCTCPTVSAERDTVVLHTLDDLSTRTHVWLFSDEIEVVESTFCRLYYKEDKCSKKQLKP